MFVWHLIALTSINKNYCHMSKSVYPSANIHEAYKNQVVNSSTVAINTNYLHQGYLNKNTSFSTFTQCQFCKKADAIGLIPVCECDDKLFHENCFRQWLRRAVTMKQIDVSEEDGYYIIQCGICHFKIRFKADIKSRCRSYQEIYQYCSQRKGFTIGISILVLFIIMCVVVGVLTLLNIVPNISEDVTRSAVLIGCGISAFFLIIVCLCCSCNCLRIDHAIIDTTYDRNGRGHKSSKSRRSTRSNRSNRSHRSHRLQIENLE